MSRTYLEVGSDFVWGNAVQLAEVGEDESQLLEVDGSGAVRVVPAKMRG